MRAAPAAVEEESEGSEAEDDSLDDRELGELLTPLVDVEGDDDDDDRPTDPYVGLDALADEADDEPTDEPEIGGIDLRFDEEQPAERDRDALGVEGETGDGLEPATAGETWSGEPLEGPEGDTPALDESELPGLGVDDDGAGVEMDGFAVLPPIAAEAPLRRAPVPWRTVLVGPEREHCAALSAGRGTVVAGSSDLLWFDRDSEPPVRLGAAGSRLSSVALVGDSGDVVLCATVAGRLLRRARRGSEAERLVGWRRAAEAGGSSAESLELCQVGEGSKVVLGRLASGRIMRSEDEGTSFELLAPHVTAIAISSGGSPIALVRRDGGALALSFDAGASWESTVLDGPGRAVAGGEAPMVAAAGSAVVVADSGRGLAISHDAGRTFQLVSGMTNVSTCAAGKLDGRATAWAAIYREASDQSLIVAIDAERASAEVIGQISGSGENDPDPEGERGRVERLVWDGERLWAAGGFGIARLARHGH